MSYFFPSVSILPNRSFTASGIIVFNAKSGQLNKKARLEILLDDSYWPAFVTERAKSTTAKWDAVGEGFVKEMEFGRVWLRLNENDDGDKESLVGDFKCDTKVFLEKCWVRWTINVWLCLTCRIRTRKRSSRSRTSLGRLPLGSF